MKRFGYKISCLKIDPHNLRSVLKHTAKPYVVQNKPEIMRHNLHPWIWFEFYSNWKLSVFHQFSKKRPFLCLCFGWKISCLKIDRNNLRFVLKHRQSHMLSKANPKLCGTTIIPDNFIWIHKLAKIEKYWCRLFEFVKVVSFEGN